MALTERDYHVHLDLHCNELRRASMEKLAAVPAELCPGRIWFNTTTNQVNYVDSAGVNQILASINDVERRVRNVGSFDASSGTVPLVATIPDPADASTDLDAGDWWVVTVGGTLSPAPAFGSAVVEPGDLVYASADAPADNSGFYVIQTNLEIFAGAAYTEKVIIAAGDWANPSSGVWEYTHTSAVLADIHSVQTYEKDNYEVYFGVEAPLNVVTLTSLQDPSTFADIALRMIGTHV